MEHSVFGKRGWLLTPGLAVVVFTLCSIALPVGHRDSGALYRRDPGVVGALARWAADLHDGFWQPTARPVLASVSAVRASRGAGVELCRRGLAEEAVRYYKAQRSLSLDDREALFNLLDYLIVNADYDRAEWYAREGDMLLHGGVLRNNLAWHYTQARIRPDMALALALSSVTSDRNPCAVDTLAWAYFRNGMYRDAVKTANETLAADRSWGSSLMGYEDEHAKQSSRKLLALIGTDKPAPPARAR